MMSGLRRVGWIAVVSFALAVVVVPCPAWSAELMIMLDLSRSCKHKIGDYRAETAQILSHLQGTCVTVGAITEESFSEPLVLIERTCIPQGQTTFDTRPNEARKQLVTEWTTKSQLLTAERTKSDIFGACCLGGLRLSENQGTEKYLILLGDMRNNTRGIDIESAGRVPKEMIAKARDKMLLAHLKGVKVWCLGVHTKDKEPVYWESLKTFWQEYFKAAGATVEAFSMDAHWSRP